MRAAAVAAITSSGTGTLTLVQVQSASATTLKITEIGVTFQGTDTAGEPIQVEVLRQTSAGTASSLTPVLVEGTNSGTIQSTAQDTFAAEPTAGDVLKRWHIHPQQGIVYQPLGAEGFTVPAAGYIGIRVVAPATAVDVAAYIEFEE